ncbi:MAG: hypothetical protein ABJH05_17605 [Fulvivirga sp.]
MKKLLTTSVILVICALSTLAQDKIFKKDKSVIDCKITEVGLNEVKYKESAESDGPIISVAVDELLRVVLESGRVIEFKDPLTDPASYEDNKKTALKLHFLSPALEHLAFSYERSIKPGRSFESQFGIIGVGFDTDEFNKSSGISLGAGFKFMRTPDFYSQRMKYAHILKGSYIKPEILLSIYQNESTYDDYSSPTPTLVKDKQDIVAGAFLINIGKQIVYDNFFLIDYSFGIGYGFSTQEERDYFDYYGPSQRIYHYGFILGNSPNPLVFSAKVKVGILLK